MNFVNILNFFGAILPAIVGVQALIIRINYSPIGGITPTWQTVSLLMFATYCVNISILAKDLQRPKRVEWQKQFIDMGDSFEKSSKKINNFSEAYNEYQKRVCESHSIPSDILKLKET